MTEGERSLPRVVNGVDLSRAYPAEDLMDMLRRGRLRGIVEAGYVPVGDSDTQTIKFVPWWDSHFQRSVEGRLRNIEWGYDEVEAERQNVEHEHPIRRRTPQQRTAAMMIRLMGEARRTGTVPGLSQDQLQTIVGESWKKGEPLAAEDVQRVAAWFMARGEVDNREADSHRTTRVHQTA